MIRKLSIAILAAAALGGCVSSGYGYRGGTGDYYYGRSSADYYYDSSYRGYGYGGYGYGYPYHYSSGYGYYGYPYGYPYYDYRPRPPPPAGPQRPPVVPNKRLPGFDYPPNAVRYPNRPGGDPDARRLIRVTPPMAGNDNPGAMRPGVRTKLGQPGTGFVRPQPSQAVSPSPARPVSAPEPRPPAAAPRIRSGEGRIQSRGSEMQERELRR